MKRVFKKGDRVRQIKVSDPRQNHYLGRTGTVTEVRYNNNMAAYGKGKEILVQFDGDKCSWIEYETTLEIIEEVK